MELRLPLTLNKILRRIEELPSGSYLNLTNSGIASAITIESDLFYGDLIGVASTAKDVEINPTDDNQSFLLTFIRASGTTAGFGVNNPSFYRELYYDNGIQLTFNPSSNSLGIGVATPTKNLDVVGTAGISSSLDVGGATTLKDTLDVDGSTTLKDTLEVEGATTLKDTLEVEGATTLKDTLDVDGATTLKDTLEVEGATTLKDTLDVDGATTLKDTLEVEGSTTLKDTLEVEGATTLKDTLEVEGSTTLKDTLEVEGSTTLKDTLEVEGSTTLKDTLEVEGSTTLKDTLEVEGATTLKDTLEVEGATTLKDTLEVEGATTLKDTLDVDGATTLKDTLEVEGSTTLKDTLEVEGSTTLKDTLEVEGSTTLKDTLEVEGATTLKDTLEVEGATTLKDTLEVENQATFKDSTNSTSKDTGSVVIEGGLGVEADLRIGGYYYGEGERIVGIVTQIVPDIGINIKSTQNPGKGIVTIDAYTPVGKTVYVSMNGSDDNTGLAENHTKETIKSAASVALPGDTIKVFPGSYIEENPIVLAKGVSIEGSELRNVTLTPRFLDRDFFYLNDGCHITDVSFIGPDMSNGAAIVAFEALTGIESGRYFDAARMIRQNLDFIASETVGYLTSTVYRTPPFTLGIGTYENCKDDIKSIWKAICFDITRGGNSRSIGAGLSYYSGGALQHIVGVKVETIDAIKYSVGIAKSVVNNVNFRKAGGGNHQLIDTQVRDLSIPADPNTLSNEDMGSCANVLSAITVCAGIVTTIINNGLSALGGPTGIKTTFPGNSGVGFSIDNVIGITTAVYDNEKGQVRITAPTLDNVFVGERLEIRDLTFSCSSGTGGPTSTQIFPSGKYGYEFYIDKIVNGDIILNVGVSTLPHTYVSGGYIVNRAIGVTTAVYNNVSGIVTITAPGAYVRENDLVRIAGLTFSCPSGPGGITSSKEFPSGALGYDFRVDNVIGFGNTFSTFVGTSTLPHTYVSGGVVKPPYSKGVGNVLKGPYVRNCTNFIGKSIGMKVDGFEAEPGDADDVGVTGAMSVDSYTQYNQGGIGVSITNGSYCQLVSIFTICDEISIYTASGGQCDITNSNTSFGNFGLVSEGVGDATSKSIYRYTGEVLQNVEVGTDTIVVSGVGNNRPYDGQAIYFGDLYYTIQRVDVVEQGSNYNLSTGVIIELPGGENGIPAEALANVVDGKIVSIDLVSSGTQFTEQQVGAGISITFTGGGSNAQARAVMEPVYYNIESATLPVSGISTIVLTENLNNNVGVGTIAYFSRLSLQIASSHSFEWVGAGNDIFKAKPGLGGVAITDNEIVKNNGGQIVYTSTDQAGNFKIGDDFVINQLTGTISGRAFSQSLLNTVTPVIIALGK
jgi:acyl-[acyl carrier protein]--UDP-N-acetylglucosamine O-acyltransferase